MRPFFRNFPDPTGSSPRRIGNALILGLDKRRHRKREMTKAQHTKAIQILEVLGLDYVELVPSGLPNRYRYRAWSLPNASQNGEGRRERKGTVRIVARS